MAPISIIIILFGIGIVLSIIHGSEWYDTLKINRKEKAIEEMVWKIATLRYLDFHETADILCYAYKADLIWLDLRRFDDEL